MVIFNKLLNYWTMSKKQIESMNLNMKTVLTHLTPADALKEIISNAIDEHTSKQITKDIKIYKKGKKHIIEDYGEGITKHAFIYNINKNDENLIGMYGYGLKDALGILNTNNVKVEIITKKNIFTPVMRDIPGEDGIISTLHLDIMPNTTRTLDKDVGTQFILTNLSDEDMCKAKSKFIEFIKPKILHQSDIGDVFLKEGIQSLYYNGVEVYEGTGYHFSYNLHSNDNIDKLLNRDRKQIDLTQVNKYIYKIWKIYDIYGETYDDINNVEINDKLEEILENDLDTLQEFSNKDVLRNIISQLNNSEKYVFVGIKEKITKEIQSLIENDNRTIYKLGNGVIKKFNVNTIKSLNKKPLFYGNTYDDAETVPIQTLMCYSSQKENKDYIKQLITNAIQNISKTITIPDHILEKLETIEIVEDDDEDTNDNDNSNDNNDNDDANLIYKDGYDFSNEQIKITEKFASNHNKLIGAIYYYIITNYGEDKHMLFDKLGTNMSNVNKKSWFSW